MVGYTALFALRVALKVEELSEDAGMSCAATALISGTEGVKTRVTSCAGEPPNDPLEESAEGVPVEEAADVTDDVLAGDIVDEAADEEELANGACASCRRMGASKSVTLAIDASSGVCGSTSSAALLVLLLHKGRTAPVTVLKEKT